MSTKKRNRVIAETDDAGNNMDAYLASADATAEFKTTTKTKATYKSHIKQYKDFCMYVSFRRLQVSNC